MQLGALKLLSNAWLYSNKEVYRKTFGSYLLPGWERTQRVLVPTPSRSLAGRHTLLYHWCSPHPPKWLKESQEIFIKKRRNFLCLISTCCARDAWIDFPLFGKQCKFWFGSIGDSDMITGRWEDYQDISLRFLLDAIVMAHAVPLSVRKRLIY